MPVKGASKEGCMMPGSIIAPFGVPEFDKGCFDAQKACKAHFRGCRLVVVVGGAMVRRFALGARCVTGVTHQVHGVQAFAALTMRRVIEIGVRVRHTGRKIVVVSHSLMLH